MSMVDSEILQEPSRGTISCQHNSVSVQIIHSTSLILVCQIIMQQIVHKSYSYIIQISYA